MWRENCDYVATTSVDRFDGCERPQKGQGPPPLTLANWNPFVLNELFELKKGKRLTKASMAPGETPFIGAIAGNNGVRQHIAGGPLHPGDDIDDRLHALTRSHHQGGCRRRH